jgi:hypothetical protein
MPREIYRNYKADKYYESHERQCLIWFMNELQILRTAAKGIPIPVEYGLAPLTLHLSERVN